MDRANEYQICEVNSRLLYISVIIDGQDNYFIYFGYLFVTSVKLSFNLEIIA